MCETSDKKRKQVRISIISNHSHPLPYYSSNRWLCMCSINNQTMLPEYHTRAYNLWNTTSITILTRDILSMFPPRPHFVDYDGYHISDEDFREAMKPRGFIDTHTIELYIRHFNLEQSIDTCGSALPTKYAFSQSLMVTTFQPCLYYFIIYII